MNYKKVFLFLFLFIHPFISFSQTPRVFVGEKPSWVTDVDLIDYRPNSREVKDGYFIKQSEVQAHAEEKKTFFRVIREIVSEAGIQNGSEISVSFDPSFEKVTFHEIIVHRNNKTESRLTLKDFKLIPDEKELSKFIYRGTYNAFLILSDVRKGDRIEFSYTMEGRNPIFGNKFSGFYYAGDYKPIGRIYTSILASKNRELKFRYFNKAPQLTKSDYKGLVKYEWNLSKLKALAYEEDEPAWFDLYPFVQVSDYDSWSEVAEWAAAVNPASTAFKGELAQSINSLKSKYASQPTRLFREAVKIVQDEVRYMGIEMGIYSHKANSPQKVFDQRFGDCKDKSLLLVSILKSMGFNASIALVNTREGNYLERYLPSPKIFDHVVVKALVQGKEVWVDATSSYQGGNGLDIYFPPYGKALVVQPGANGLVQIPESKKGTSRVVERFTVRDERTPALLEVESVYSLDKADDMRSFLASESIDKSEQSYLEYYTGIYPKIVKKDSLIIRDDKDENIVTVLEKYEIPEFFSKDSITGAFTTGFYATYISSKLPKVLPNRKHPIKVAYPFNTEYICKVVLPGGWNVDTRSRELRREDYYFQSTETEINDTLSLKYEFSFLRDHIPAARLKQFASDVQLLKDDYLEYNIIYTPDTVGFYPNYPIIAMSSVFVLICLYIAFRIYRTPTAEYPSNRSPLPIGGWLIVVALGLSAQVYIAGNALIENKDFDLNHWQAYSERGTNAYYKFLLSLEIFTYMFMGVFAMFCLFLLLKCRDIFPKTTMYYLVASSILVTVLNVTSDMFYGENFNSSGSVFRSIISVIVWTQYFKRSERVRDTFVVPYVEKEYVEEVEEEERV